jgi:pullulanase/glycogen debranching enzyme
MPSSMTATWWTQGLRNYWGYNSIGFFAPDMRYSATGHQRIQDHGQDAA